MRYQALVLVQFLVSSAAFASGQTAPEPGTLTLLGVVLVGLAMVLRKMR
jgi:hypothetical protein